MENNEALKAERATLLAEKKACRKANKKFDPVKMKRIKEIDGILKDFKPSERSSSFKPGNDFSWWNKEYDLLKNSCNLKSDYIPGSAIDPHFLPFSVPGVIRYAFKRVYGINKGPTDPINVWARDLYLRMFQKWRGISSYSASDLAISLIASLEVVSMVAKLERIYGVINRYSKQNLNMPRVEEEALGLSQTEADWIRGHLSDYRYDLNVLIKRAERICIPKDMSVISDWLSLLGYEYLDHDDVKAQIVLFDCDFFGVYSDTLLTTGGSVKFDYFNMSSPVPLIDISGSSDNMFVALESMVSAIIGSDSVNKIFGDLVTWFGEGQLLQMLYLPEDYVVAPVYSESILHKIHNIDPIIANGLYYIHSALNSNLDTADLTLLQGYVDPVTIIYQLNDSVETALDFHVFQGVTPTWFAGTDGYQHYGATVAASVYAAMVNPTLLDTYRTEMNEETVTEGVLFKYSGKVVSNSGDTSRCFTFTSVAFEIITSAMVYRFDPVTRTVQSSAINFTASTNASSVHQIAAVLAIQDWAPVGYLYNSSGEFTAIYGDVNEFVPIYDNTKMRLHNAILYSGLKTEVKVLG